MLYTITFFLKRSVIRGVILRAIAILLQPFTTIYEKLRKFAPYATCEKQFKQKWFYLIT